MDKDEKSQVVEIWKTTIEVQKHFNDISMRIRSIFITALLALLASIGFVLDKKLGIDIAGYKVQFYVMMPLFGIAVTGLFYFIDRYWYHQLLLGSVLHGAELEKNIPRKFQICSLQTLSGKRARQSRKASSIFWRRYLSAMINSNLQTNCIRTERSNCSINQ